MTLTGATGPKIETAGCISPTSFLLTLLQICRSTHLNLTIAWRRGCPVLSANTSSKRETAPSRSYSTVIAHSHPSTLSTLAADVRPGPDGDIALVDVGASDTSSPSLLPPDRHTLDDEVPTTRAVSVRTATAGLMSIALDC